MDSINSKIVLVRVKECVRLHTLWPSGTTSAWQRSQKAPAFKPTTLTVIYNLEFNCLHRWFIDIETAI